jgi:uncharacterized protein (DUF488 family)
MESHPPTASPRPPEIGGARTTVLTIGHSTRSAAELIELLRLHAAEGVIDVRTIPRSRRNPQFDRDTLGVALGATGIGYRHVAALGGLRRARRDSPNAGWRNASFRGYADYMQTPAFAAALQALIVDAQSRRLALMCAEAVPWRCHRLLIADALVVHGIVVEHIVGKERTLQHALTPWAVVTDGGLLYPSVGDERADDERRDDERGDDERGDDERGDPRADHA